MAGIVKHQNVKVIAEKATSNHETHFLQLNNQLELKVSDDDVLTQLQAIDGNIVDVETILNSQTTELQAIKTNTANIKASIEVGGDLYVSQDEVEAKLDNIFSRQDDILSASNNISTKSNTIASDITALKTANHTDLDNIFSRQDDILNASNNISTKSNTIASDITALKTANHTDLDNIFSRQDDILTSCNATKLTNDTIATKTSALLTANHTDLNNIFSRQDDILTATNAVKTNTQSVEDCIGIDGATGPAKCISIGGTNPLGGTIQEIAVDGDGHLSVDILSSALPSGAAGEISNSAIATAAGNILTKTTLATSSEVKQLLSGVTVNAGAFSSEFDTENYERIRFFGETTANTGSDILLMGSNVSGGTFYVLGDILRGQTTASTHYVYAIGVENLPRYIKIFNKSGSTNYVFTKLYLQGSGGRLGV